MHFCSAGIADEIRMLLSAAFAAAAARVAQAADITGVPKIREGDQIAIGNNRIRLGGIDAPSVDQLCLNNKGERWTCGVAARDELIKHAGNKSWTCHTRTTRPPRPHGGAMRGRRRRHPEMAGANGWALSYTRVSHDYEADEKAAREAKAGMWQGAFIAPWDWRARNKKTTILGAAKPPENASILKAHGAELLGRFFIALIAQAAQERATLPKHARLPTVVISMNAANTLITMCR